MDALSDILSHLKFEGSLYFTTEFTAPWGVRVPAYADVVRFHLVTRGRCHVAVLPAGDPVLLEPGDFVLIPHGAEHAIADRARTRILALDEVLERSGYDGAGALVYGTADRGEETRLVCGHFAFDGTSRHPLLDELPESIVVRGAAGVTPRWLEASLALLEAEQEADLPGREAIVHRLTEILFVQAIRTWMDERALAPGLLKALADPRLARALAALHRAPERAWTVEALAREAGLSRSLFAERFHALTGTTPLRYVTAWRLEKARRLLLESGESLERVAAAVGYRSPAAFSRAFARQMGTGPGAFRRRGVAAQP